MRRAFIMGSNGPGESGSLQYALKDAENIKVALSSPLCQFEVSIPSVKSKSYEVLQQLAEVAESCTVHDTFICYFSGHGILEKGSLFLLWDESLPERLNTTALSVAKIMDTLSECNAHSKLLILDCCHAGAVINKYGFKTGGDKSSEDNIKIQDSNYWVIMASDRLEYAREIEVLKGSFLTINICSAISDKLNEADKDKDGKISIPDLNAWLNEKCIEHNKINAKEYHVPQPHGSGRMKGNFFLTVDTSSVEPHRTTSLNDSEQCPYRALEPFSRNTAKFFFGRTQLIEDLQSKLKLSNFVLLFGASGIGKSSVVQAGLTPELEKAGWKVLEPIVPWLEPVKKLKDEVIQQLFPGQTRRKIQNIYSHIESNGLVSITQYLPSEQQILIIIDQFEEVFTVCSQKAEQEKFIELLTQVNQASNSRLKIVATVRADFVEDCLKYQSLTTLIQHQSIWIPPLEGEDLKQVITEPSERQNYSFEEGLPELIIQQIGHEKNFLPLLQFALTAIWEQRDSNARKLTATQYLKQGGVLGVLNRRAEEIYKNFDSQEREWVKRIFLKLVRTGIETKDTRQRQPKQKLMEFAGDSSKDREAIQEILNILVEERLLVAGNDIEGTAWIDLAHEALMDAWEQYVVWRNEGRELRRLRDRVEDTQREWIQYQRDPKFLMMGGLLAQVKEKWSFLAQDLSCESQEFYEQSKSSEEEMSMSLQQQLDERKIQYKIEAHKHQIEAQKYQIESQKYQIESQKNKAELEKVMGIKDAQIEIYRQQNEAWQEMVKTVIGSRYVPTNNIHIQNIVSSESQKLPDNKESLTYDFRGSNISGDVNLNNQNNYVMQQKQRLAEAAAEIQQLLNQLETTNPITTDMEKIAHVNNETTPSFKRRVVGALEACGAESAIEEFLDNPYVNVGKAIVKGWIKPE